MCHAWWVNQNLSSSQFKLLASSPTPEGLMKHIGRYLGGEQPQSLAEDGTIIKASGNPLTGHRWVKKGGRYRFEG